MKKIGITIIKSIGFFLGWAILNSILPLPSSKEQAIWRLWAEITPLLAIAGFTFVFWLAEKKNVKLHLFDNPVKGMKERTYIPPTVISQTFEIGSPNPV